MQLYQKKPKFYPKISEASEGKPPDKEANKANTALKIAYTSPREKLNAPFIKSSYFISSKHFLLNMTRTFKFGFLFLPERGYSRQMS